MNDTRTQARRAGPVLRLVQPLTSAILSPYDPTASTPSMQLHRRYTAPAVPAKVQPAPRAPDARVAERMSSSCLTSFFPKRTGPSPMPLGSRPAGASAPFRKRAQSYSRKRRKSLDNDIIDLGVSEKEDEEEDSEDDEDDAADLDGFIVSDDAPLV